MPQTDEEADPEREPPCLGQPGVLQVQGALVQDGRRVRRGANQGRQPKRRAGGDPRVQGRGQPTSCGALESSHHLGVPCSDTPLSQLLGLPEPRVVQWPVAVRTGTHAWDCEACSTQTTLRPHPKALDTGVWALWSGSRRLPPCPCAGGCVATASVDGGHRYVCLRPHPVAHVPVAQVSSHPLWRGMEAGLGVDSAQSSSGSGSTRGA